jgi:hypothetical protein
LKTFEYYVEIPSKGLRSAAKSIKLDVTFFSQLAREIRVGPDQMYTTIQRAIDAAVDYTRIIVASGTYTEQINLKGKKLSVHGGWNNGYPPVIDASGGTAVTIPFTSQSGYDGWIEISGFKITNAVTGILAQANTIINQCLFTNSSKAIRVFPDSCTLASALIKNPFLDKGVQVNISNCTFIASKSQAAAVIVQSGGLAAAGTDWASDRQLLSPLKMFTAGTGIHASLFAYYGSIGGSSTLPVQLSGRSSNVWLESCAAWQTPVLTSSDAVKINGAMVLSDPSFKDPSYYFTGDSSEISSLGIGYGVSGKDENTKEGSLQLFQMS